jgi:plastocyanin
MSKSTSKRLFLFVWLAALALAASTKSIQAEEWQLTVGAESADRGSQALAFLPNEAWIHAGDTIRWAFPTHERHTVTFLQSGQIRPPAFGPTFGIPIGCPGITPDGSSFNGAACVTSGILLLDENAPPTADVPTYSVQFPSAGNFKLVCLVHADMTGVVHVGDPSATLPRDQNSYDRQARIEGARLITYASRLQRPFENDQGTQNRDVAAGIGEIVTMSGAGSQTASLMRFSKQVLVVRVGDTVEWTSLDPSINHTVTFGTEPQDPRPPSPDVTVTSDAARYATIDTPADSVNSGFLSPTPQDRANLAQAALGITRFRVTFKSVGTFNYICAVHDQLGMKATVIVRR